ncbi:MAG: hypothetical protein V7704_01545 [Aurantimonas endophytica]|uniref:hypothetical protein n=1 Tax=Aurantimonas endophytica TaxID=1522175 RepID=UPI003001D040
MSASDAAAPVQKRRYARLTPATWAEIRSHWEVGEATLVELSERYGASTRALQMHFAKHDTLKGSKAAALAQAVQARVLEDELPDGDLLVERAKTSRERAYRNASTIEDLVMSQLAHAQASPEAAFKAGAALKALSLAAGTLERLFGLKSAALGLDNDPTDGRELPKLILEDITREEIDAIQRGDDDNEWDDEVVDEEDVEPA